MLASACMCGPPPKKKTASLLQKRQQNSGTHCMQHAWVAQFVLHALHLRNIRISNLSLHLKRASIKVRKLYSFDHTHFNQGSCVVEPVVYVAYSLHQVPLLDILLELLETRAESSPPACSAWVCPPQNIHIRAILSIGWICLCLILLCCHGRKLSAGKAGKMRFSMCYACAFWSIAMHLRALDLPTEKWHVLTIFSSCFCCCDLAWMVGDLAIIQEAARQLYIYDIIYTHKNWGQLPQGCSFPNRACLPLFKNI